MTLTAERLRQVLDYDPKTDVFRWRITTRIRSAGQVAGHHLTGAVGIDGKLYPKRKLVALYTGQQPITPRQFDRTVKKQAYRTNSKPQPSLRLKRRKPKLKLAYTAVARDLRKLGVPEKNIDLHIRGLMLARKGGHHRVMPAITEESEHA